MTEIVLLAYAILALGVLAGLLLVCIGIVLGKFVTEKQFNKEMSEFAEALMNGEIDVNKMGVSIIKDDAKRKEVRGESDDN